MGTAHSLGGLSRTHTACSTCARTALEPALGQVQIRLCWSQSSGVLHAAHALCQSPVPCTARVGRTPGLALHVVHGTSTECMLHGSTQPDQPCMLAPVLMDGLGPYPDQSWSHHSGPHVFKTLALSDHMISPFDDKQQGSVGLQILICKRCCLKYKLVHILIVIAQACETILSCTLTPFVGRHKSLNLPAVSFSMCNTHLFGIVTLNLVHFRRSQVVFHMHIKEKHQNISTSISEIW